MNNLGLAEQCFSQVCVGQACAGCSACLAGLFCWTTLEYQQCNSLGLSISTAVHRGGACVGTACRGGEAGASELTAPLSPSLFRPPSCVPPTRWSPTSWACWPTATGSTRRQPAGCAERWRWCPAGAPHRVSAGAAELLWGWAGRCVSCLSWLLSSQRPQPCCTDRQCAESVCRLGGDAGGAGAHAAQAAPVGRRH